MHSTKDDHCNYVGMYYVIYTEKNIERKTFANMTYSSALFFSKKVGGDARIKIFKG